mmetsp:Transcript_40495/g.100530  ORF Transcript_40495/g.100530 Transcript_40495/m.100530 type:complete len:207 (-) Transcript_40495:4255-4875(-)
MEICELIGDLRIEWKESVHAGLDLLAKCISFLLSKGLLRHGPLGFKLLQLRVQAVHRLDKIGTTELHVADTRWLEDATSGVRVRVHFHHVCIDGWVDNNPCPTAQLAIRRDIDEDRLLVSAKVVDNVRTEFKYLPIHIASTAGETAPVSEHNKRQIFGRIEICNSLGSLICRVGIPDLSRLGEYGFPRVWIRWIGRDTLFDKARFH